MPDSYDFDPAIPLGYRTGAITGWRPDPEHAKRFAAANRTPVFALAAPGAMDAPARDVFLMRYLTAACRELYGKEWKYKPQYQKNGTCFLAGTGVLMADGTEKAIDEIAIGDRVVTHTGEIRSVAKVGCRKYTGWLNSLRMHGCVRPLVATAEHPVLTRVRGNRHTHGHNFRTDWACIGDIKPDDLVFFPAGYNRTGVTKFDLANLLHEDVVRVYKDAIKGSDWVRPKNTSMLAARYLPMDSECGFAVGLYAAEGCCETTRVTFVMHASEVPVLKRVAAFAKKAFNAQSTLIVKHNTARLRIGSKIAALFFTAMVPGKAITKSLSANIFQASLEFCESVVCGWCVGDGHIRKRGGREDSITAITSSMALAIDMERLSTACGLKTSISSQKQASHQNAPANRVEFSGSSACALLGKPLVASTRPKNYREVDGGFDVRVKSNTRIWVEGVSVYNLEVEGDHSYVVAGVAVHNCVGQSHKTGTDIIMAVNRFVGGTKFIGRSSVCANYAGGRVEIAGQPGRWDGSNGSWSADWLTKYGIVLLKELNLAEDSRDPDEKLAVEWAARSSGVPAEYETIAKSKPISNAALVQTTAEVRAALNALCYVNICTSLIPGSQRDADGVSRMSNQGGHSTGIVGCRLVRNEWVYAYVQSWGDWASGPYGWLAFDPDKQYATTIVDITEGDLSRVLQSRDCYALSGVNGFEVVDPVYFL